MTPERAQKIIDDARALSKCGPWSDRLDEVMTTDERQEIKAVWDTMPGYTCFVDALYRIARHQVSTTTTPAK